MCEASPLKKRSLAELSSLAGGTFLVTLGVVPMVVFVGGAIGLVVIRGANAISGALWEGARPEVVEVGGDSTAVALDIIRRWLGIHRRSTVGAGRE